MARWFVTGCSTGIGREIARAALTAGHSVVVTARKVDAVQDLVDEFGDRALALPLDVTDRTQIAAAVETTVERLGGIDVLVNNAGYGYMSAVEEGDDAEVRALFDTNYFGVVDTLKVVLPLMRAQGSGHVVNISSMTGLVANPPNVYYSCTKFALEALTEGLAKEVGPFGIHVTAIEPGAFRTDWAARSMKESAAPLEAYAADVGARKELIKAFADHLPGDPRKVADAVLMVTGLPEPPLRLLLGKDVLAAAREKLAGDERLDRRVGARHRRRRLPGPRLVLQAEVRRRPRDVDAERSGRAEDAPRVELPGRGDLPVDRHARLRDHPGEVARRGEAQQARRRRADAEGVLLPRWQVDRAALLEVVRRAAVEGPDAARQDVEDLGLLAVDVPRRGIAPPAGLVQQAQVAAGRLGTEDDVQDGPPGPEQPGAVGAVGGRQVR